MNPLLKLAEVLPKLGKPIQILGLVVIVAGFVATNIASPNKLPAQVAAGSIGVVFLICGLVFPAIQNFPFRQRVQLVITIFLISLVVILSLLFFVLVQTEAIDLSHHDAQLEERLKRLSDSDSTSRVAAAQDLPEMARQWPSKRGTIAHALANRLESESDSTVIEGISDGLISIGLPEAAKSLVVSNGKLLSDLVRTSGKYAGLVIRKSFPPEGSYYNSADLDQRTPIDLVNAIAMAWSRDPELGNKFDPSKKCITDPSNQTEFLTYYSKDYTDSRYTAWSSPNNALEDAIAETRKELQAAAYAYSVNVFVTARLLRQNSGKLAGTNLERVALYGVDLEGIDLHGVLLPKTILIYSDFSDAILDDADLQGAKLDGTCFQDACLRKAKLAGASFMNWSSSEQLDRNLSNVNLMGADWSKIDDPSSQTKEILQKHVDEKPRRCRR